MKEKLTQERLKELLDYDCETGLFTWKISTNNKIKIGSIAGCLKKRGYWVIRIDNNDYYAQRLAFLYMEGYFPENEIDHIDRNKINNKWNNIREVNHICNMRNKNMQKNNKSGIMGIIWRNKYNKWEAYINIYKYIYLGVFDNLIDAAKARWEAEVKYNFPNCNTTSSAYNYLKEHGVL